MYLGILLLGIVELQIVRTYNFFRFLWKGQNLLRNIAKENTLLGKKKSKLNKNTIFVGHTFNGFIFIKLFILVNP